ncbi:BZ3500_MvSof-1268-A1-R1_Chr7-3g09608 [Microbotryum saponariae]|uniref:BZ3500_MvSof-1268-A1-R1_Chr7-3g09608 protein n=1 Tax=Microbotryum saponariae TaxID=289078 RepID=A0A2X0NA95_9BASI|nr:BZ3501_MvSof-1269-A2-R1_Chr7-2g09331 [Microbotryum saponariae]SDA02276.1 BZ3500_MvSof-1268-A1-R1_Chr7-3g09608 [Microbotryum saponariae]
MVLARSGLLAATLLVLQSTLSIAAPVLDKAIHALEKRIACHTNEIAITSGCFFSHFMKNSTLGVDQGECPTLACCVLPLYTNATKCSRSEHLTCSYGVPNSKRKCAAVDCSKAPGTCLSPDAKQCLPCTDPNVVTCNSTTTLTCLSGYTLSLYNTCFHPIGQERQIVFYAHQRCIPYT